MSRESYIRGIRDWATSRAREFMSEIVKSNTDVRIEDVNRGKYRFARSLIQKLEDDLKKTSDADEVDDDPPEDTEDSQPEPVKRRPRSWGDR